MLSERKHGIQTTIVDTLSSVGKYSSNTFSVSRYLGTVLPVKLEPTPERWQMR
jgi:hypothetical protein